MTDFEFKELLKTAVENFKDKTVLELLENDATYQDDTEKLDYAERQYMHLDLTVAQKEICDSFFKYKDRVDFEYGTHAYTAGLIDAFRFMLVLFPDKWKSEALDSIGILEQSRRWSANTSEVKEQGEADTP